MEPRLSAWLLPLVGSLLALSGCRRAEAPPAYEEAGSSLPITVGIAIPSYVHAVAWLAKDEGFFERASLRAQVQVMGGSAATMRALIARAIDVGLAGGDAALKANKAGADLVVVAGLVDRFYHRVIVRQDIRTPEDLRGKTIGLPFLGGPQDMAAKYALASLGLAYGEDVGVVSLGREFNRIAALSRNEIQATTSQTPLSRLKALGLRVLVDLPAADAHFPYLVVVVRREDLRSRPAVVRSFLKGLCDATAFYKDPSNEARSLDVIGGYLTHADNRGAATERYETSGPSLLSYPPEPTRAAFDRVLDLMGEGASAGKRLASLLDPTALQAVQREGACLATAAHP